MRRLIYALRFEGLATPVDGSTTVLRAQTRAGSCAIESVVGPGGLRGQLGAVDGDEASFESEVTFTGEATFQESGTIAFGPEHRLRFATVGSGYMGPSAESTIMQGGVTWRVEGGDGQFAGARGLITSNFLVGPGGEVTDHHFGVLWIE